MNHLDLELQGRAGTMPVRVRIGCGGIGPGQHIGTSAEDRRRWDLTPLALNSETCPVAERLNVLILRAKVRFFGLKEANDALLVTLELDFATFSMELHSNETKSHFKVEFLR